MNQVFLIGVAPWIPPLRIVAAGVVGAVVLLFVLVALLQLVAPKLTAIARATAKEAMLQPLFWVLLAVGLFLVGALFPFLPYNTFGEDIKVVKDQGLTLIMAMAVVLAVWTASVSVSEEIEGRTALTVLSKPIARWHFVVGKFVGILFPVAVLFIVLGALFLSTVSFKLKYDARETSNPPPTAKQCEAEMVSAVPGLALAFMRAVVLASIGVAISTRLSMLPNLIICGAIYVLGHLVPTLVNSTVGQLEYVPFVANLLALVLPMLEHFDIYGAISTGHKVTWDFLGWAGLYCVLYSVVALLVALLLFEDRDLA
ncbi:MAG: ABC transporter permease [Pirellulales bacterium]|nr:ABC transporter permease [Pirellulales bacterium]